MDSPPVTSVTNRNRKWVLADIRRSLRRCSVTAATAVTAATIVTAVIVFTVFTVTFTKLRQNKFASFPMDSKCYSLFTWLFFAVCFVMSIFLGSNILLLSHGSGLEHRRASILVAGANEKLLFITSACRQKLFLLSAAMAVTAVAQFWPLWIHHPSHL